METALKEAIMDLRPAMVVLPKSLVLLKIQANQNEPLISQTFFCADCQSFLLANGLFPALASHTSGHALAWVPALDEPGPGRPEAVMTHWLAQAPLDENRKHELQTLIPTSNSSCWALLLEPQERDEWFDYLYSFLERLGQDWLAALNGWDTEYFRADEIWVRGRSARSFNWSAEDSAIE